MIDEYNSDETELRLALNLMARALPSPMVERYQQRAVDEFGEHDDSIAIALCEAATDYIKILKSIYAEYQNTQNNPNLADISQIHIQTIRQASRVQGRQTSKKG